MPHRPRHRGSTRPPSRGRGFTLLEILIALALATALVSLVSVAVLDRLRGATFDETIRQTRGALTLVREDARRLGEPLRLIARENKDGRVEIVALPFDAPVEDPFAIEEEGSAIGEIDTGRIAFDEDAGSRTTLDDRAQGRVYLTLPRRYTLERMTSEERDAALRDRDSARQSGRREEQDAPDGLAGPLDGPLDSGFGEREGPLTIGLFLPDGSVIAGDPPVLRAPGGAIVEIAINPWTGSVTLAVLRPSDPYDTPEEELEDLGPPAPEDDEAMGDRHAEEGP